MPISTIYCIPCGCERYFFSQPGGKSIRGNCGHVIHNHSETKKAKLWATARSKARKKLVVRNRSALRLPMAIKSK